ncbi:23S rRNA (adenine(2030)-N(6))-methyltransferase RlmJ [Coraliomargarita parva]|uniref:23S rRNA (adenine(2030)-N(6))-methyltransferase RlmJ n=1 Tax=Coraliomargarita parva TaxID=3014050 RepID=UPI0022B4E14F|nr:23S rRNA (adenine(2030)-N(6))-methyltransferase RlmJ [Coraliomargarita parva]
MLSYRHSFHAGNFADVLKHLILAECLEYLKRKDKPFAYYDTHAGPGRYVLDSGFAQKNKEYETGIGCLWEREDLPECLRRYRELVRAFNPDSTLRHYPGSPAIAQAVLRPADRLRLCELHPADHALLAEEFGCDRRVGVEKADGFERVLKQLPPSERRGLILIDPPYELKEDYQRVLSFLETAHRKFAQGLYLLWYPVVERARIEQLQQSLAQSGIRNIQCYELGIRPDTEGRGMTSSGMIVINPPWTLMETMAPALPYLSELLGSNGDGTCYSRQLVPE